METQMATKIEETWKVIGFMTRQPITICPGVTHPNTASCEKCGQSIKHVVSMLSSEGHRLDVGEDCAVTLQGGEILRQIRNAQRAWEREEDERLYGAERRMKAAEKLAAEKVQALKNEETYGMALFAIRLVLASGKASDWDAKECTHMLGQFESGKRYWDLDEKELNTIGKAYRNAILPESKHIGIIGGKVETVAILERVGGFDTMYGIKYIFNFRTADGAVIVWFTTGGTLSQNDIGSEVKIKGTVKEHSDYKGTAQTVLTRCKTVKV